MHANSMIMYVRGGFCSAHRGVLVCLCVCGLFLAGCSINAAHTQLTRLAIRCKNSNDGDREADVRAARRRFLNLSARTRTHTRLHAARVYAHSTQIRLSVLSVRYRALRANRLPHRNIMEIINFSNNLHRLS